jgi:hypothetical protein
MAIADMELLAIVDDLADENGWTSSHDVRIQLGEQPDDTSYRSGIPQRLGWMRRYGWLEKGERERRPDNTWSQRWRLTAMGQVLLDQPELSPQLEQALSRLTPAKRLVLTKELAEIADSAPGEIRNALRRQWARSMRGAR